MVKLYLKKLLLTIVFFVFFFLFLCVVAFVWVNLDSALESFLRLSFPDPVDYWITLLITLFLELIGVYFLRIDSLQYKKSYVDAHDKETFTFSNDFLNTLRSGENIVHTVAFLSAILPFDLLIAVGNNTPIVPFIFGMLLLLIVGGALFAIINTLLWCLIHKKWLKD